MMRVRVKAPGPGAAPWVSVSGGSGQGPGGARLARYKPVVPAWRAVSSRQPVQPGYKEENIYREQLPIQFPSSSDYLRFQASLSSIRWLETPGNTKICAGPGINEVAALGVLTGDAGPGKIMLCKP